MFDFHRIISLSDNDLPAEVIGRSGASGFQGIGLILRTDGSCDLPDFRKLIPVLRRYALCWGPDILIGVELCGIPPAMAEEMTAAVRNFGAELILGRGEGINADYSGKNRGMNLAWIEAGVDIITCPGLLTPEDAALAAEKRIFMELSLEHPHCLANGHLASLARVFHFPLTIGSGNRLKHQSIETAELFLAAAVGAGLSKDEILEMNRQEHRLLQKKLLPVASA